MKKILFAALLVFASVMVYAQPRAIGVRLGSFNGLSYEHGLGDSNMLEIEAGWGFGNRFTIWDHDLDAKYRHWMNSFQAAVTYDWIDPFGATFPSMPKGEWHWYLGLGATGGYGWWNENFYGWTWSNWVGFVGGTGRVGVEYDFWFPLQISLDWRPTVGPAFAHFGETDRTYTGLYWDVIGVALGVRYKF